jgi:hypothetical protein
MMNPIEPIVEELVRVIVVIEPVAQGIMIVDGRILPRLRKITASSGSDGCNHIEYRKTPENARGSRIDTDAQEFFIIFIVDLDEPFRIPFAQSHISFPKYSLKEALRIVKRHVHNSRTTADNRLRNTIERKPETNIRSFLPHIGTGYIYENFLFSRQSSHDNFPHL